MKENDVLKRFPVGGSVHETRILRQALFHTLWAFENVEGQEPLISKSFAAFLTGPPSVAVTNAALEQFIEDTRNAAVVFRSGAEMLRDASLSCDLLLLDRKAAQRRGD